jgi:hypothetical protein
MEMRSLRYVNRVVSLFMGLFAASLAGAIWAAPAADVPPKADAAPEGREMTWESIGPGGGGWIQSITWDPNNAETLHVGCDVGGYYLSSDAGQRYERRNAGLVDYFFETMAVHPQYHRIILAGTETCFGK